MEAAYEILVEEIRSLRELVQKQTVEEMFIKVDEAAEFLGISTSTLYKKVESGQVPFRKRFGYLYFYKSELNQSIKNSPVFTA